MRVEPVTGITEVTDARLFYRITREFYDDRQRHGQADYDDLNAASPKDDVSAGDIEAFLASFDVNKDGRIDVEEWERLYKATGWSRFEFVMVDRHHVHDEIPKIAARVLAKFDIDKNGSLSRSELKIP